MTSRYVIKAGATFRRRFTWLERGVPVDLTGATVAFGIENATRDPARIATLAGAVDPDQTANRGQFEIEASATETAGWPTGEHIADMTVEFPGGDVLSTTDLIVEVRRSRSR